MKILARNDYVVLQSMETEKTEIAGGLLNRSIQGDRGVRPCVGMVIAVGPKCTQTKEGQILAFDQYHSGTIEYRGEKVFAVKEDMLVGELTELPA